MRRVRDRLAAHNERVKLLAGFFNTLGLGFIGVAFLRPLVEGTLVLEGFLVSYTATGVALHGVAYYIVRYLEKEVADDDG